MVLKILSYIPHKNRFHNISHVPAKPDGGGRGWCFIFAVCNFSEIINFNDCFSKNIQYVFIKLTTSLHATWDTEGFRQVRLTFIHLYLWTWTQHSQILRRFRFLKSSSLKSFYFDKHLTWAKKAVGHLKRLFQASVFAWFVRQILWRILFKLCFLIHSFVRFLHGTLRKHQLNVFQTVSALCLPLVVRGGVSFPSRVVELLCCEIQL